MIFINNIAKEVFLLSPMLCNTDLTLITTPCWGCVSLHFVKTVALLPGGPLFIMFVFCPFLDKEGDYVNFSIW